MKGKFGAAELEAKRFLERPKHMALLLASEQEAVESIRQKAMPQGIAYDGIRVQTSPENRQEEIMVVLAEAEEKYLELRDRYAEAVKEVGAVIAAVGKQDMDLQAILTWRYMAEKECAWIAEQMHYSERAFYYKYCEAHKAAEQVIRSADRCS